MFTIGQAYDLASLTALCRAARKTVQKWRNVIRAVCWVIFALGIVILAASLLLDGRVEFELLAAAAVLLLLLLFEDRLNGWISLKRMIPGTARSVTVFAGDAYTVTTDALETRYQYENITALCESERYFFLFLGKKHGQIFDKQGFRQGDPDAFRVWLEQRTGKTFQTIK